MKKVVYLLIILLLVGCKTSEISEKERKYADDINQLADIIINEQVLLCDIDELENSRKKALTKIKENMSERDFYLLLLPIVNCGRINLVYPQETIERFKNEGKYIPIKIETSDNKMYLIDDKTERLPLGSEIMSINEYSIENIMEIIYMRIPVMEEFLGIPLTEESKKIYRSQIDMTFSAVLIHIIESSEYEIILNNNGESEKYILPAINYSELSEWMIPQKWRQPIVAESDYPKDSRYMGEFKGEEHSTNIVLKNSGFVVKIYKDMLTIEKNEN